MTWIINSLGPGSGTARSQSKISFGFWMTTLFITHLLKFGFGMLDMNMIANTMNDRCEIPFLSANAHHRIRNLRQWEQYIRRLCTNNDEPKPFLNWGTIAQYIFPSL